MPLTLGHKVLNGTTIAANKTVVAVVTGGSTTVPSNATTVKLTVSAKGANGGALNFYPAGNIGGGSGQHLVYPAHSVVANATIEENVGQSNELTVANSGTGSVAVTVTLIGYSTQVTAGDIGGTGGTAGQVLTNNGAGGASWLPAGGSAYAAGRPGPTAIPASGEFATAASLAVPAGSYFVTASVTTFNFVNADDTECVIVSPGGYLIGDMFSHTNPATLPELNISASGLVTTTGGTITLQCGEINGVDYDRVYLTSVVAVQVSSVSGTVTPFARHFSTKNGPTPLGNR